MEHLLITIINTITTNICNEFHNLCFEKLCIIDNIMNTTQTSTTFQNFLLLASINESLRQDIRIL